MSETHINLHPLTYQYSQAFPAHCWNMLIFLTIILYYRDVVHGLAHLHELGIIHRDLKPQNVLIIKERSLCGKLSDMGISKQLAGDMTSLTKNATG